MTHNPKRDAGMWPTCKTCGKTIISTGNGKYVHADEDPERTVGRKVTINPTTVTTPKGQLDGFNLNDAKTGERIAFFVDRANAERRVKNEGWTL